MVVAAMAHGCAFGRSSFRHLPMSSASKSPFAICRQAPANGTRSSIGFSHSSPRTGVESRWSATRLSSSSSRQPPPKPALPSTANSTPTHIQRASRSPTPKWTLSIYTGMNSTVNGITQSNPGINRRTNSSTVPKRRRAMRLLARYPHRDRKRPSCKPHR